MSDKRLTEEEVVVELRYGMTIGIGGWGSRRKPMSIVRGICRSSLRDLTVVTYGGPEVGLLCAAGKIKMLVYGFVSLDSIALDPHFRAARQDGSIEVTEFDEGMLMLGLHAAAQRVPFLPTRNGLGSDVLTVNAAIRTFRSPYGGETLVAVPALKLDAAIIHMNRADQSGNAQYLGPDIYFDDVFARAADLCFLSCERVVATQDLSNHCHHTMRISRLWVDGVVEAPRGAHFTSCTPDYERDEAFQREYVSAARDPDRWAVFSSRFLHVPEADYQRQVGPR